MFRNECIAQPVGEYWNIWEVRTDQSPYLDELTLPCQFIPKALFLLYRVRHVFFLARQKENVGDILVGKAHLLVLK